MGQRHIEQPGLRARMGKERARISSQHRQLDLFHDMILRAGGPGDARDALRAFERFFDAFEAHISLEDSFYFPAVRSLHPSVDGELAALSEEHVRFRELLEDLKPLFETGDGADAWGPALAAFVERFSLHERREEELLAKLSPAAAPRA